MRKILYILTVVLAGAWACTKSEVDPAEKAAPGYPEGAKVAVRFSVIGPDITSTKAAMKHEPVIENMYVAVFMGTTGRLREYQEATLDGTESGTDHLGEAVTLYNYSVDLLLGSTERHIHFIANGPSEDDLDAYAQNETDIMGKILTQYDSEAKEFSAAYWQTVVLEDGITAYRYDKDFEYYDSDGNYHHQTADSYEDENGQTVYEDDYVTIHGNKITNNTGYFVSKTTSASLATIPLIRNFAKIYVTSSTGNFTIDKIALANVPSAGFIAPYTGSGFESAYVNVTGYESQTAFWNAVYNSGNGYEGNLPSTTEYPLIGEPDDAFVIDYDSSDNDKNGLYMYERPIPSEDPTCLLVYGKNSTASAKSWYKIELTGSDGGYLPVYRGFTYTFDIQDIEGEGWEDIGTAYDKPAYGDVSASTQTENLTAVSDGNSTIQVNKIEFVANESNETVTLLYKYEDYGTVRTSAVEFETATGGTALTTTTITGTPYSGDTPDGESGWYQASITLGVKGDVGMPTKVSKVKVKGTSINGKKATLYREVTFRVMSTQTFVEITGTGVEENNGLYISQHLASEAAGEEMILKINLPEMLGYGVFPLVLRIEAENNNLNPTGTSAALLPTEIGASYFDSSRQTFYFLKTINYSDYYDSSQAEGSRYTTEFTDTFKTVTDGASTASGTNATRIAVTDSDGYFSTDEQYATVQLKVITSSTTSTESWTYTGNQNLFR